MNTLQIELNDCYGIRTLSKELDFSRPDGRSWPTKAYSIYAPNGCMKSSFAKTFDQLSKGNAPLEERHNRRSSWRIEADGTELDPESIYVLKADIDLKVDIPAVTDLLVKPDQKQRYDALVVDLDKKRQKALNGLNKASGIVKKKVEEQLPAIFQATDFLAAITIGLDEEPDASLDVYSYATIFEDKALKVIQSENFREKASEFNERYDELFRLDNTIYSKQKFNPARADAAFGSLKKEGYFKTGHRVYLRGENAPFDEAELERRLDEIHNRIDGDQALQKLRKDLSSTTGTRALTDLIESLDNHQFDYLIDQTRPENIDQFKRKLWVYYLHQTPDSAAYRDEYSQISAEIEEIESQAAEAVPAWEEAVERFNRRFLNMPFKLRIANQKEAALGQEAARLLFVFEEDGQAPIEWQKSEVKSLSQGERRAMHLLSFIFEVEARRLTGRETLFICDDPADSFDYKNKHAIVQYLEDLTKVEHFHLIILTHNFDLFRTFTRFTHRNRCLAAVRDLDGAIQLQKFEGISNIFENVWKPNITSSDAILVATIAFTRNLIEYTSGKESDEYKRLTTLLHWRQETTTQTVGQYFEIFNQLFHKSHDTSDSRLVTDILFAAADEICLQSAHNELQLENKIVLSIATRLKSECFITEELRVLKDDADYWPTEKQYGNLLRVFKEHTPPSDVIETLELVSITVSSNIHLNSFMYEPLLDLSTQHLCDLYRRVCCLEGSSRTEGIV